MKVERRRRRTRRRRARAFAATRARPRWPPGSSRPPSPTPGAPVLFCVPGMSYGKEYWDLPPQRLQLRPHRRRGGPRRRRRRQRRHRCERPSGRGGRGDSGGDGGCQRGARRGGARTPRRRRPAAGLGAARPAPAGRHRPLARRLPRPPAAGRARTFEGIAVLGFSNQPLEGIYEDHEREAELTDAERFAWATEHLPPKLWGRPGRSWSPTSSCRGRTSPSSSTRRGSRPR